MSMRDELHLRQTRAFIDENPVEVVIVRSTKQATDSGGWKWANPQNLDPQVMRKVGPGSKPIPRTSADGREVKPTAVMIGMPDTDIQIGDWFNIEGKDHEVVYVDADHPPWRSRAEVFEHGQ